MSKELCRCSWLDTSKSDYVKYHDTEWGVPVHDDKKLFEFIILESAQAGLSWYTILKRRGGYQKAFSEFNVQQVALFNDQKIDELVNNSDIVRHRGKIEAVINNANIFIKIQKEHSSFSTYLWSFVNNKQIVNTLKALDVSPTTSEISDQLSKDLKKRGFKFFGSTICYAYLQACGLINDHSNLCFRKTEILNNY